MVVLYLRFADLKERGIVSNWQTLSRWIEKESFPRGVMLGANTRAWTESEINEWLAGRPQGGKNGGE
jgi:hypothetical protein